MVHERDRYPAFNIPIACVPASIDNNLPGAEMSIGTDTAINNNAYVIDRIRQSASASLRCFVVETMGRKNGYLALMSAIATGAEKVYLYENGITLAELSEDTKRMVESFKQGRQLYLVVRNENASEYYTTDLLRRIFEEEGGGLFDVRSSIIGHMQQGGNPSPFDRTLAVRMVHKAIDELAEAFNSTKTVERKNAFYVGQLSGKMHAYPVSHMPDMIDMNERLPYDPWWKGLEAVLQVVADKNSHEQIGQLPTLLTDTGE